jgi:multiple sugar transport system ATP-binding protein
MTVFRAKVSSDGAALVHPAFTLPVPESARAALAGVEGREIEVGIRPENLMEPGRAVSGPTGRIPLEVELVEPLGHEVVVHGRVGEDAITAKLAPTRVPAVGSRLEVVAELDALHLFDPQSEARLN